MPRTFAARRLALVAVTFVLCASGLAQPTSARLRERSPRHTVAVEAAAAAAATPVASHEDTVQYSHAGVAHESLHKAEAVPVFTPHTEPQPPGTVIHHMVDESTHPPEDAHQEHQTVHSVEEHAAPIHPLPTHVNVRVAKAPEHYNVHMTCPAEEGYLHILDSSFGQGQGTFDPQTGVIAKGFCHQPMDSQSLMNCQGKSLCVMEATTQSALPDPCPGVSKRLVVTYKCTHNEIPTTVDPIPDIHSPPIELHAFINPPSLAEHDAVPSTFFHHFFQNQQISRFPFPEGEECEEDAHRLCGGLLKNCVGDFGCTTLCLTDHVPHLSNKCLERHPCFVDIDTFCRDVQGGENMIMQCLKENASHLSHQCTQLHPCLLDAECHRIDYDNHQLSAHQPIFQDLPKYMGLLHQARQAPVGSPAQTDTTPFMHLVLPSVVRQAASFFQQRMGGGHQVLAEIGREITAEADAADGDEAYAQEGADEDAENEADPTFDAATLGTGHFSHIKLAAHPEWAVDVHTKSAHAEAGHDGPAEVYEVALWEAKPVRHQLFDYNHFGQIFWVHTPANDRTAHTHYCLTPLHDAPYELVSEACIHLSEDQDEDAEKAAQVWRYDAPTQQLHHHATGKCLEVQAEEDATSPAHAFTHGSALYLADCATHRIGQQWAFESALMVERNPHIFDEHHAAVRAKRAEHAAGSAHPSNSYLEHDAHTQHAAPNLDHMDAAQLEQLRDQLQKDVREIAQEHDQLLAKEHHDFEAEEAHIARLEQEVARLQQQEATDHATLQREEATMHAEHAQLQAHEAALLVEQARLAALEREIAAQHGHPIEESATHAAATVEQHPGQPAPFSPAHGERRVVQPIEATPTEMVELHHTAAHAPVALPKGDSEPLHFFTPVTLLLSVLFVGVLAYVFRLYLVPLFFERCSRKARRDHYYSHAY